MNRNDTIQEVQTGEVRAAHCTSNRRVYQSQARNKQVGKASGDKEVVALLDTAMPVGDPVCPTILEAHDWVFHERLDPSLYRIRESGEVEEHSVLACRSSTDVKVEEAHDAIHQHRP